MKKNTKRSKAKKRAQEGSNFADLPSDSVGAFKLRQAAQYLGGLHAATVRRLVERGLLNPNRALRHLVFSKRELDRFLQENTL
jgi:Helix-turn-helix domain